MKINVASYRTKDGTLKYHTLETDHLIAITQDRKQKVVRERYYYLDSLGRRSDIIFFSIAHAKLIIKERYNWQIDFKLED